MTKTVYVEEQIDLNRVPEDITVQHLMLGYHVVLEIIVVLEVQNLILVQ
jgi:hypothetical protein